MQTRTPGTTAQTVGDAPAPEDRTEPLRAGDLVLLAAVGALVVAAVLGFLWYLDHEAGRQHAEAPVDVLAILPVPVLDADGQQDVEYDVSYRFEAGGRLFAGVHTEQRPDSRAHRKVCYNPEDPADHSLVAWSTTCGETLLFGR